MWFRRDLRLHDNHALHHALSQSDNVYCVFIFDKNILNDLKSKEDQRIEFIWEALSEMKASLNSLSSDITVIHGDPIHAIPLLLKKYDCEALFFNKDYESYANKRDMKIVEHIQQSSADAYQFKDTVLFEEKEILSQADKPYTVFSPYKNNHLAKLYQKGITQYDCENNKRSFAKIKIEKLLSLDSLGFTKTNLSKLAIPTGSSGGRSLLLDFEKRIDQYKLKRDYPGKKGVSYLSVHNRFGTISIREQALIAINKQSEGSLVWLNELIWRDFYFQILSNFPHINDGKSFKPQFNQLRFENNVNFFEAWKNGRTGFPIIDAAMHQLNKTGFMHNRLRMIVASFLVKDLLIDWRWGESYFAEKLIDFDFSANNGGWQWAASTGCDAQPWFRIFNPLLQSEKFDPEGLFIKKYLPQLTPLSAKEIHRPHFFYEKDPDTFKVKLGEDYPFPIVDHAIQRQKALSMYQAI